MARQKRTHNRIADDRPFWPVVKWWRRFGCFVFGHEWRRTHTVHGLTILYCACCDVTTLTL